MGDNQTRASVALRIAETMHAHGVRFAFGIPGNDVLELIRACESVGIRFILVKSEPSAGFMADAVAQLTGNPAACIFALGPGVANGVTGIAGAFLERTPVIILGGEMAANRRGVYTHQVFDHVAAMTPITKWAGEMNPERAAQQTAKALDIAMTEPRGSVYLNCPGTASTADATEPAPFLPATGNPGHCGGETAAAARSSLAAAKRPLALIGLGAVRPGIAEALKGFLEAWQLPFLTTFKAKGAVSERHPQALGALGLSPIVDEPTLKLVREADYLTLIGFDPVELRDAWLDAWDTDTPCLTIDWAPQNDRVFPAGLQVIGDLAANLEILGQEASPASAWPGMELAAFRQAVAGIVAPRDPDDGVSPAALFAAIDTDLTETQILSVDVGAHRILACHALHCLIPNQLLQSNGLCSMGYAIPAAAAAALAEPEKRAVAILGDGCALMSLGELAVIAEHNLPVTIVILNDARLALIELKQSKMQVETGAVRFTSPQFAELASGFGIEGFRAATNGEFRSAYQRSLSAKGPVLIEAVCDPSEYWEQM